MSVRVVVLGSTGSIGTQTLQVIEALPGEFEVVGLGAGTSLEPLAEQAHRFRPKMLSTALPRDDAAGRLDLNRLGVELVSPEEMAASPEVDLVVLATTGQAGLAPALAALAAGKRLALANKEIVVMAGHLLHRERERNGGRVHPVDSEHSAVWQCLLGETADDEMGGPASVGLCQVAPVASRVILTASGGAFRDLSPAELSRVTPQQALRHPTWRMGPKVTIDSATLFNKGLEVIEAHWLFGVPYDKLEVVLHRESVVHSLVEFVDGSVKAQMSVPDMRLPIQYALTYPRRLPGGTRPLNLVSLGQLSFAEVNVERFRGLELAIESGRRGGTYPAVMAAADEAAVGLFMAQRIAFTDIPVLVERVLQAHTAVDEPSLAEVLSADAWARRRCEEMAGS